MPDWVVTVTRKYTVNVRAPDEESAKKLGFRMALEMMDASDDEIEAGDHEQLRLFKDDEYGLDAA